MRGEKHVNSSKSITETKPEDLELHFQPTDQQITNAIVIILFDNLHSNVSVHAWHFTENTT